MLKSIVEMSKKAGEILKHGYFAFQNVGFKGEIDLVTDYDRKIELFLIDEIGKISKDIKIMSEEFNADRSIEGDTFIIDPIDGTTNFVHNFPFCAVSIAFYSDKKRYGVVYNPILEEIFYAETGSGAFLNGERIAVSDESRLINSLIATGFPYSVVKNGSDRLLEMLGAILKSSRGVRRAGSASLDLCYVAKSVFQGYYEAGLKPWDVAAGIVILEEAGGTVSDIDGGEYSFYKDIIVASNSKIHGELLGVLNGR
ncbi:MAG: inositol monophosphatase [Calditerrivibrio sp.]|nr:inositol monophosphatase [Calditerrivibrio sp.]